LANWSAAGMCRPPAAAQGMERSLHGIRAPGNDTIAATRLPTRPSRQRGRGVAPGSLDPSAPASDVARPGTGTMGVGGIPAVDGLLHVDPSWER